MDVQTEQSTERDAPTALYDQLEERVLARDQVGASQTYYDLLRAGRPLNEIVAAGVRIHAPYTHVPYHERFDDGYPNFVNNDHCLLSARATLNLARMLPGKLAICRWRRPSGTSRAGWISGTRRSTRRRVITPACAAIWARSRRRRRRWYTGRTRSRCATPRR